MRLTFKSIFHFSLLVMILGFSSKSVDINDSDFESSLDGMKSSHHIDDRLTKASDFSVSNIVTLRNKETVSEVGSVINKPVKEETELVVSKKKDGGNQDKASDINDGGARLIALLLLMKSSR